MWPTRVYYENRILSIFGFVFSTHNVEKFEGECCLIVFEEQRQLQLTSKWKSTKPRKHSHFQHQSSQAQKRRDLLRIYKSFQLRSAERQGKNIFFSLRRSNKTRRKTTHRTDG